MKATLTPALTLALVELRASIHRKHLMNAHAVRIFHFLAVPWALAAPVLAGTNSAGPWVAASWILQAGQGDTLFLKVYGVTYDTVDAKVLHPQLTDILQCQDNPTFMAMGTNRQMGLLSVSVRDFARFVLLYLREGDWKGAQLISREHARMAVSSPMSRSLPSSTEELAEMIPGQRTIGRMALPQKQGGFGTCYSWLWWVNGVTRQGKHHWPDAPLDTYAALGAAGNAAVVIPSLDLIVVLSIG